MIGGLFIYNRKGGTMICRIYRDDITRVAVNAFRVCVLHSRQQVHTPVVLIDGTTFLYKKCGNVCIVAATRKETNVPAVFEIIQKLQTTMIEYFGQITEENVRSNFVLIYELLDELVDFGYPQLADTKVLKMYITQSGLRAVTSEEQHHITSQVTGQISWRHEGIRYSRNELFITVLEQVNLLMNQQGQVLCADVSGKIEMQCHLSGMPECKFGINDRLSLPRSTRSRPRVDNSTKPASKIIKLDDIQFHQCVRLGRFESERTISFVPPDGPCELFKYRTSQDVKLPFKIFPLVREVSKSRLELKVILKSDYEPNILGTKIMVRIPVPPNTCNVNILCLKGKAKYNPEENAIVWKIKRMGGGKELHISADVELLTIGIKNFGRWVRPPVSVDFAVPFAPSGFRVQFLKIVESKLNYSDQNVVTLVRYMGRSGQYETRC